ncbi:MAG: hypothetical protein AAF685_15175 [Cyanobacteria bacterium P01_C01_bin.89]
MASIGDIGFRWRSLQIPFIPINSPTDSALLFSIDATMEKRPLPRQSCHTLSFLYSVSTRRQRAERMYCIWENGQWLKVQTDTK